MDIDVVITWVDNKDPEWAALFAEYSGDSPRVSFESLETFRFVFRGIEQFLPWVRNIYLVTQEHVPKWLNRDHPQLRVVRHEEIFKDYDVLPTFNSGAIEMNLHRIPGLSERFIFFNDDMFAMRPLPSSYFFRRGVPTDFFLIQHLIHDGIFSHRLHTMMQLINESIPKKKLLRLGLTRTLSPKYGLKHMVRSALVLLTATSIPQFRLHHHPQAHLKQNFYEVEARFPDAVNETVNSRFRSYNSLSQYMFRFWGLIQGRYHPAAFSDAIYVGVHNLEDLKRTIARLDRMNPALVCFNEHEDFPVVSYPEYEHVVWSYLQKAMPTKSRFELY